MNINHHDNIVLPAGRVDEEEVQQIYKLQPKHLPQDHTAWCQIIAQVLYTTEQTPIHVLSVNCAYQLRESASYKHEDETWLRFNSTQKLTSRGYK